MKQFLFSLFLGFAFSLPAHAEMGDCWHGTAPTAEQYLARLKTGDACEVRRVPEACEIKVMKELFQNPSKRWDLMSIDLDYDSPVDTIALEFKDKDWNTKEGSVKVKYGANNLGDCTILSIRIQKDSEACPDGGC
jgi:hypothetical protein